MKERKQRRTLSGAVLIMVLTVMFVLIILLMATLTVVTTANQRIYTKFEENQAYYTARSALDVFTLNMMADGKYKAYDSSGNIRTYSFTQEDATVTPAQMKIISASASNDKTHMKQGLALQMDMYSIESQSKIYGGDLGFVENPLESDNIFYTVLNGVGSPQAMPENSYYTVSNSALNDNADTAKQKQYIEYKVTLPDFKSSSDDYGRFVDKNSSGEQIATIRVEVLSRVFDTEPSYTTDQIKTIIAGSNATAKQELKDAIRDGMREKDQIRVKITSTVQFADTTGVAVLIYDTKSVVNNFQRALTMFSDSGAGDSINIIGDTAVGVKQNWTNDSIIYGNFYANDGLFGGSGFDSLNNGPKVYVTAGESVYLGHSAHDFQIGNDHFQVTGYGVTPPPAGTPVDKDKRPYLYVDGNYIGNKVIHGGATSTDGTISGEEIDFIVSKDLKFNGSELTVNGDVYVGHDLAATAGGSKLVIDGDIYVGNDFDLTQLQNGFTVTGNIYIKGNFITGTKYFTASDSDGDGKIDVLATTADANVTGNIYLDLDNGATVNGLPVDTAALSAKFVKQATPAFDFTDQDTNTDELDLVLPNGVQKSVPTHSSNFNDYYMKDANGNLVLNGTNAVAISAEQKAFTDAADFAVGNYTTKPFNVSSFGVASATEVSGTTAITSSGVYHMSPASGYNVTISGGGTVDILMDAGQYSGKVLVSDDKTTVNFYGTSVGLYQLFNMYVYNNATNNAVAGGVLNVGNKKGFGITAPKINYYFSGSSTIDFYNGAFLTGYIYAPGATVTSNTSGTGLKMNYNGNSVNGGSPVSVNLVGAVLCDKLQYQNSNNGMAYINPELRTNDGGGDPPLTFKTYQYMRS